MPNDNEPTSSADTKREPPDRSRLRARGHVEEFGQGRVCATPGCEIVLSRYNSGRLCWTHEQSSREKVR